MPSTAEFLRHVLPSEGHYAAFIQEEKRHEWFSSTNALASRLVSIDTKNQTVYYGCSSFLASDRRIAQNVRKTRSFWLDVDAGEGKPYADAIEAAQAVAEFCRSTELPSPIYVASGYGIYAIWPLDVELAPDLWRSYAAGLKRACVDQKLFADPARTSDIASILRAPGTHNRKFGKSVEVQCGPLVGPYSIEKFSRLLDAQTPPSVGRLPPLAGALAASGSDGTFAVAPIVRDCSQIRALQQSKGQIAEPLRHACFGVVAYCEDAERYGNEWNQRKNHDPYTPEEIKAKFDQLRSLSGATTCAHFHSLNPAPCKACPHFGEIKSPISLGRAVQLENGQVREAPESSFFNVTNDTLPQIPHDFYWRADQALIFKSGDGVGGQTELPVSRFPIYLDGVQTGEVKGEYSLVFRQKLPAAGWITLSISAKTFFGANGLAEMADRGANIHEPKYFHKFVRESIDMQHLTGKSNVRYDQFGWKHDDTAFLYGLTLYNGKQVQNVPGNDELQIRCKQDWVGPCRNGSFEIWRDTVNRLFATNHEPHSVALLASFAAPLMPFQTRDEGGGILHLVSTESATGKSIALSAAASVWGRREGLSLINDDTRVSKALTLAALGNLPVIYDELSMRDPEALRNFVLTFTNGRDRMRGTRDGHIAHNAATWQNIMIAASNTSVIDLLSQNGGEEAPAKRVLELNLDDLPPFMGNHAQADRLKELLRVHSGHAGALYMNWLTKPDNLSFVRNLLQKVTQDVWEKTKLPPNCRFRVRMIAAIAVAGAIVQQMELIDFSPDRITRWLLDYAVNHGDDGEKPEQKFVDMLATFLDENRENTLVLTKRGGNIVQEPTRKLRIRIERDSNRCFIARQELQKWMVERKANYRGIMHQLEKMGIIVERKTYVTLGAGTRASGGQTWCVEVDMSKRAFSGVEPKNESDNVVAIR